jgi:hypothetical protein
MDVPLIYEERAYTGRKRVEHSFIAFDRTFTLRRIDADYSLFEIVRNKRTLTVGKNNTMPLSYVTAEYREFVWLAKTRTVGQAEYAAREGALSAISRELPLGAEIITQNVLYERIDDFIRATVIVTVVQRIDTERIIRLQ